VFGRQPGVAAGTATTDARFYINEFGVPALCYGPRARDIHGVDEAVELRSVADGARVLARFLCDRFEPGE
jgi:acetylornithine deacetylase